MGEKFSRTSKIIVDSGQAWTQLGKFAQIPDVFVASKRATRSSVTNSPVM